MQRTKAQTEGIYRQKRFWGTNGLDHLQEEAYAMYRKFERTQHLLVFKT